MPCRVMTWQATPLEDLLHRCTHYTHAEGTAIEQWGCASVGQLIASKAFQHGIKEEDSAAVHTAVLVLSQ